MAPDNFRAEDGLEIDYVVPPPPDATEQIATLQNAFKFPPRAIRDSLFENFWTYCYAWDPIVDRSQVIGVELDKISPLLLQTIFLAGSQMISPSQPRTFASPQEYYTRAKTLFWLDYEKDPVDRLIASSLMHWWNPHGPERVSTNTSSFWCRITARDCLISVAHGRPQAIALEDCDIPLPTLDDFPGAPLTGSFFIAYVELSLIIGRFTQKEIRKASSNDSLTGIEDCLYRWTKNLPEILRPSYSADRPTNPSQPLRTYNLESRQLNVLYLTTIILLRRSRSLDGPFPTAAVVAASTMAGVFEDFLARDEVRFLGPAFSFHLLAASIALLSCYKYPDLWELAQEDLKILNQAQEEMKKRWPTAIGSLSSFDRMFKLTVATQMKVTSTCNCSLTSYEAVFFEICDMKLCRMYAALVQKPVINNGRDTRDMALANADAINPHAPNPPAGGGLLKPRGIPFYSQEDHLNQMAAVELEPPDPGEVMSFDRMFQEEAGEANDTIGDWLFWNPLAFDGN
ncbi:hypothetical protein CLAIMM_11476 [Cladophialophora immunda]|nr:hypothetical protein CLAIMM_11476 [Cladophialophora immunda]